MAKSAKTIKLKYVCPDEYKTLQAYYKFQNNPEKLRNAFKDSDEITLKKKEFSFTKVESFEDLKELSPNIYKSLLEKPREETIEKFNVTYEEDLKMKWQIEQIVNYCDPISYSRDNVGTCPGERNTIWKEELLQSNFFCDIFGIRVKPFNIKYIKKVLNKPLVSILLAKAYILPNSDWNWKKVNTDMGIKLWDLLTSMVEAYEQKKEWNDFGQNELILLWEALKEPVEKKIYQSILPFGKTAPGISYSSLENKFKYGEIKYEGIDDEDVIELAYNELAKEFGKTFTSIITEKEFRDKMDEYDIRTIYSTIRAYFRKEVNKKYRFTRKKIKDICKNFETENKVSESHMLTFSKGEQVKFHPNLLAIMKTLHDYGDILPTTVTKKKNIWKSSSPRKPIESDKYHVYKNFNIKKEIWESYALTKRYFDYYKHSRTQIEEPHTQIEKNEFLYRYYKFLFLAVQKIFKRGANQFVNINQKMELDINIYQFEKIFAFYLLDKETRLICNWIESQTSVFQVGNISQDGLDNFINKSDKQLELLKALKYDLLSYDSIFSDIYHFCGVYQRIEIAEVFTNKIFDDMKKSNDTLDLLMYHKKILKTKEWISMKEKDYLLERAAEQNKKLGNNSNSEVHQACNEFYQRILERVVSGAIKNPVENHEDSINRTICNNKAREYLDEQGNLYKEIAYIIASSWQLFDNFIEVKGEMEDGGEEK